MSLCLSPPPLTPPLAENSPWQNLALRARGSNCRVWSEGPVGDGGELRQGTEDAANNGGKETGSRLTLANCEFTHFVKVFFWTSSLSSAGKKREKKKHRLSGKKKGRSVDICVRACVCVCAQMWQSESTGHVRCMAAVQTEHEKGAHAHFDEYQRIPHSNLSDWLVDNPNMFDCVSSDTRHTHTHTHETQVVLRMIRGSSNLAQG